MNMLKLMSIGNQTRRKMAIKYQILREWVVSDSMSTSRKVETEKSQPYAAQPHQSCRQQSLKKRRAIVPPAHRRRWTLQRLLLCTDLVDEPARLCRHWWWGYSQKKIHWMIIMLDQPRSRSRKAWAFLIMLDQQRSRSRDEGSHPLLHW